MQLVNGEIQGGLSVFDRGFNYGDGLFETLLIKQGRVVYREDHLARLELGCKVLNIRFDKAAILADMQTLLANNENKQVMKIVVTRGPGGRGYRPGQDQAPSRILTLHSLPPNNPDDRRYGIDLFLCKQRLAINPSLAGIKHLNRLEQVLASAEWPEIDSVKEGLMLDSHDRLIEGTRSNVFVVSNSIIKTPLLNECGVEGVMRNRLITHFDKHFGGVEEGHISLTELGDADEVFVCNSVLGILPAKSMIDENYSCRWQIGEFSRRAQDVFEREL